jgi:hypothetical protein
MNIPVTRILAVSGLLLLAACTSQPAGIANPPIPTLESPASGSSSAEPSTPSVGDPVSAVPQPPAPSAEPPAPPQQPEQPQPVANGAECKAADLKLGVGQSEGAAGTVYRSVLFTNKSNRSCTIQGFPGVSYVTGDDGHQVGPAAVRVGAKGAVITLSPGATAQAPVGFTQVRNFDSAACKPTPVKGLRIYPPHDTASMFLPMDGTGCAGNPPGQQLSVKTVQKA